MGEGGVLTIQLSGRPALPLRPISDTEFSVQGANARVVFHGEKGEPAGDPSGRPRDRGAPRAALSLVSPLVGMLLTIPAYGVALIGSLVRSFKPDNPPTQHSG